MFIHPFSALILFPWMLFLMKMGRHIHKRRRTSLHSPPIENAVFALFGLLLAFTFSGAVTRYYEHRKLIVRETDDISTVQMYIGLLPPETQPPLRQLLREYTVSRLHLFDRVGPEISSRSEELQTEIWNRALAASTSPRTHSDTLKLLMPAINEMIGVACTRQNAFHMHPPQTVYLMLFVFAGAAAFMVGYGIRSEQGDWLYSVALAFVVTLTVYATLEVEFPREGLIRFTQLDQPFISLIDSMK